MSSSDEFPPAPSESLSVLLLEAGRTRGLRRVRGGVGNEAVEAERFSGFDAGGASGVRIANAELLRGEEARAVVYEGGTLVRATRYSLTCRDVARVAGAGTGRLFGRR